MRGDHEEVIISDLCHATAVSRTAVDCYMFTDDVVIADEEDCLFAAELEVLWCCANDGEWKEFVFFTDIGEVFDCYMIVENVPISDLDMRTYDAVRTDSDIVSEFGFAIDYCCWMNGVHGFPVSDTIPDNSGGATGRSVFGQASYHPSI